MRVRHRWRLAACLTAVVLAAAGGIAYAAIPSNDGTISACYQKVTGAVRVVDADAGARCAPSESAISWATHPGTLQVREAGASTDQTFSTHDGFDVKLAIAKCDAGERATGGGYNFSVTNPQGDFGVAQIVQTHVTQSQAGSTLPDHTPNAWFVEMVAPTGIGYWGFTAYVVCAKVA